MKEDTKPILRWVKDELDPYGTVMVNIMGQYLLLKLSLKRKPLRLKIW